jgi:hypothetical protein
MTMAAFILVTVIVLLAAAAGALTAVFDAENR